MVTVYATLGMDAVVEAVKDNAIPVIVCNKKDVARLAEKCKSMNSLKVIVYTNDLVPENDTTQLPAAPRGVTIVSFDSFCDSGNCTAFPATPPAPDTTAVVMVCVLHCVSALCCQIAYSHTHRCLQYTSGSTGKPKGVIITHRQVLAVAGAADIALGIIAGADVYLAYLPLAHIMELMAEFVMLSQGCTMCYADPKSLTTTGAYPMGALEQYKPSLMVAVPKIWDVIKKGIQAKVAAGGPVKEFLVNTALEWRLFALNHGFDTPFFKALVFKKIAAATGGNLRYVCFSSFMCSVASV